jgi:EmrB/QacA subfamily drug resistance transporter
MEELQPYAKRWWALGVLILSLFVISLDNTIMNVTLPTLVRALGASATELQWIVDAYVLVFAGLLLTAGSLGDRFGRKGALTIGLVLFGLGSAAGAFATTPAQLIAIRAFMGIGGALIMPATLSILTNVFPAGERARAIAIWSAVAGLGFGLGPAIGGWMLERFWWGSVLLVNVPVVTLAIVLGRALIPTSKDPAAHRPDPLGAVLSVTALAALLYGIIEAPRNGWGDTTTLVWLGGGLGLLATFVAWELRTDHPMLDMRFFRNPRFTAASISITLSFFALAGSMFFLTQIFQFLMGYSTLKAGVAILPAALASAVGAPTGALLAKRLGSKVAVVAGLVTIAAGLAIVGTLSTSSGYGLLLAAMIVAGFGVGIAMTPATESIMGSLPTAKAGVGSAVNDTTREVGGALGVAVLGSLLVSTFGTRMAEVTAGLPAAAAEVARDSLGGALAVAQQVGGQAGQGLVAAARTAFVDGTGLAMLVGAGFALGGALVALLFLPARAHDEEGQRVITVEVEPVEDGDLLSERVA